MNEEGWIEVDGPPYVGVGVLLRHVVPVRIEPDWYVFQLGHAPTPTCACRPRLEWYRNETEVLLVLHNNLH